METTAQKNNQMLPITSTLTDEQQQIQMTLPMHLGLISYRLGRPLEWNNRREKFQGDHQANQLLARKYRKKWDLL